jgi:hypothetical protein
MTMLHPIVSATFLRDYKIEIEFDNGKKGIMDFSKYLVRGGVFERFKDNKFFRRFEINKELGILSWQGEIDIAPESLYAETTGSPLPDWMEKQENIESANKT